MIHTVMRHKIKTFSNRVHSDCFICVMSLIVYTSDSVCWYTLSGSVIIIIFDYCDRE